MRISLAVLVSMLLVTAASASPRASGPSQITFPGKLGEVLFPHSKHQEKLKIACVVCHHVGLDRPKCSECHGTKGDVPVRKDIYHKLCKGCHLEKDAGPTTCKACHPKIK